MSLRCLGTFLLLAILLHGPAKAMEHEEERDYEEPFLDMLYMPLFLLFSSDALLQTVSSLFSSSDFINAAALKQEISTELFENF